MGVIRPDLVMKSVIPCLMAGMIAIYGLIIGIMIGIKSMIYYFIVNDNMIFLIIYYFHS